MGDQLVKPQPVQQPAPMQAKGSGQTRGLPYGQQSGANVQSPPPITPQSTMKSLQGMMGGMGGGGGGGK